jgi:lipoprotein-anchoring transpeptidase ErfK/SrfK
VAVEDPFVGLQAFAETEGQAREEAVRLAAVFKREVPVGLPLSPARKELMEQLARQQLEQAGYIISRPQTMVVVDRNPAVQRMALFLAMPGGSEGTDWPLIGSARVSTGTVGRKHYYITPTGVFINTADRLGYRALGTKNENGIMGIGVKGMRVWDFGWQEAEKGWLPSREKGPIRLEMHATDPVYLEQRLGRTASAGCIRIPATVNVFLDRYGLLDAAYEHKALEDIRFKALLRPDREPSVVAGVTVVVVDTGHPKESDKTAALKDGMAHKPTSG